MHADVGERAVVAVVVAGVADEVRQQAKLQVTHPLRGYEDKRRVNRRCTERR